MRISSLWKTCILIVVASMLLTAITLLIDWTRIQIDVKLELIHTNNNITHATQNLLDKNEFLLEVLGHRLIEINFSQNTEQALALVDNLLKNSDLLAFGLASLSGELILTSSNLGRMNLPNLLHKTKPKNHLKKLLILAIW